MIGVQSFSLEISVSSEIVFHTLTNEACGGNMEKVYSVMPDTTSMNTGRKTSVNKRFRNYVSAKCEHDAHVLERMLHVNEIVYLSHVISVCQSPRLLSVIFEAKFIGFRNRSV